MDEAITTSLFLYLFFLNGPVICKDNWNGTWFPYSVDDNVDNNPVADNSLLKKTDNSGDRPAMGRISECDDCKSLYDIGLPTIFGGLCLDDTIKYLPRPGIKPLETSEHIPIGYTAPHFCKNGTTEYGRQLPTFGPHLPNWAKYGEYEFLPKQRWLHNLEHGAVVMLYHPCANTNEVNYLRKLVRGCLYRHVITPYSHLTPERPLALVTWGHLLELSLVSKNVVVDFIKRNALHGPEQVHMDGLCDNRLIKHAEVVSDISDKELCPNF